MMMLGYTMLGRCNRSIIVGNIRQSCCHIVIDGAFNYPRVLIHASLNNGAVLREASGHFFPRQHSIYEAFAGLQRVDNRRFSIIALSKY